MVAGKKLSPAEKYLVARTYECIRNKKKEAPKLWKGEVRNHVHESLGIAKSTISAVWGHWEKHHDPEFAETTVLKPSDAGVQPGRPRKFGECIYPFVRDIVTEMNQSAKPVAAPAVAKRFKEDNGIDISVRSIRRVLRRMGMRFKLKAKIDAEFDTVVSDTWINAYEHVQEFEEKYMQQADACELAANAVDNVDGGVRDAEEGDNTEHDGSDVNDED
ncbi:hypothetical protein PC122_g20034 [Phytophthora cactorum]|nr:hypothetical protein PC122_g20034 [Phytophthora cactorum]